MNGDELLKRNQREFHSTWRQPSDYLFTDLKMERADGQIITAQPQKDSEPGSNPQVVWRKFDHDAALRNETPRDSGESTWAEVHELLKTWLDEGQQRAEKIRQLHKEFAEATEKEGLGYVYWEPELPGWVYYGEDYYAHLEDLEVNFILSEVSETSVRLELRGDYLDGELKPMVIEMEDGFDPELVIAEIDFYLEDDIIPSRPYRPDFLIGTATPLASRTCV